MKPIPTEILDPEACYTFVAWVESSYSNPNGDPDADNSPRIDPETQHGIITDVCLKRKIRDFVQRKFETSDPLHLYEIPGSENGFGIFIRNEVALNKKIYYDTDDSGEEEGEKKKKSAKNASKDKVEERRKELCRRYYDVRMFGAVLSTGGEGGAGRVTGPMQVSFGISEDPVLVLDFTLTRQALTKEDDAESKNNTMGKKSVVAFGLYRIWGFYSPFSAKKSGVTSEDLQIFWTALLDSFGADDKSACRTTVSPYKVVVFKHRHPGGDAHYRKLETCLKVEKTTDTPRRPDDYRIEIEADKVPNGIETYELQP